MTDFSLDTGIPGCVKTIFDFKMWGHVSFNVHFNDTHPYNVIIYQWKWGNFLFYGLNFEFSHSLVCQYPVNLTSAYSLPSTRCRTINLQSLFQSMCQFFE